MTKRDVVKTVLAGTTPPYVPWNLGFTHEAQDKLKAHYKVDNLEDILDNHFIDFGSGIGFFDDLGNNIFRDHFGVTWDRTVEKDIGMVIDPQLSEPSLKGYVFPNPGDTRFYKGMKETIESGKDGFRIFSIGFSLYERAWTLRGTENLLMDMLLNPEFVHELLGTIADYNIAMSRKACSFDIDAVYFGDDWGQQQGLIMGPDLWHEFIGPQLKRMYKAVHDEGKKVFIHSCGDVDELFDALIDMGLNCFNPFQPEVMDVFSLIEQYRGRLVFHGGLSTQQILPFGTPEDVRRESRKLLEAGAGGGYIFSPAHAVEGDVPLENMITFIEELKAQKV
ncbi:MAG: uroporphyrinogen decarboxylase [Spirochaetales bacterium]|nr:uroporphyrinogen decarboxylase [Spirochaetales bacterium]